MDLATSAASSASTRPVRRSRDSPISGCTRCSTAGRSRRESPPARAGTHDHPRSGPGVPGLRRGEAACPAGRDRRGSRALLDHGVVGLGERAAPSGARIAARSRSPTNGKLINAVELHAELTESGVQFRGSPTRDHRRPALAPRGSSYRGCAGRSRAQIEAPSPRWHDQGHRRGLPRSRRSAALSLGRLGDSWCVASESCAFDIIGAELVREWRRARWSRWAPTGSRRASSSSPNAGPFACSSTSTSPARLDPRGQPHAGLATQDGRDPLSRVPGGGRCGDRGARLGPPAASGYSRASGIPRDDGLIKNRYVARTFIQPGQELRKHGLRMKFNPLREVVEGKRLVVVDDSIVRGNTTRQIVKMLRDAGALEIHMRISAPPIRHPCHYGIDMSTTQEMVAHGRSEEEIARELDCDSLAYLSLDGVYEAIRSTRETHCDSCLLWRLPAGPQRHGQRKFRARGACSPRIAQSPQAGPGLMWCRALRCRVTATRARRHRAGHERSAGYRARDCFVPKLRWPDARAGHAGH